MAIKNGQIDFLTFGPVNLKSYEGEIQSLFAEDLKSASLFLLPLDTRDAKAVSVYEDLSDQISSRLNARSERIPLAVLIDIAPKHFFLLRLLIRDMAPDIIRKEIEHILSSKTGLLSQQERRVRITQFGIFLPRTGIITCRSFAHGEGHYSRYRLATFKLDTVHQRLREFLLSIQSYCPDQYFKSGPRASSFNAKVTVKMECSFKHPLVKLAVEALKVRKLKSAHEDIEKYLLDSDPETIACEVPIWFEPLETKRFAPLHLNSDDTLTGHIDILRWRDSGVTEIWDYKPSAADETKAHVQVYLYALMLSARANIPLEQFICGYFDSSVAFFFSAAEAMSWSEGHSLIMK